MRITASLAAAVVGVAAAVAVVGCSSSDPGPSPSAQAAKPAYGSAGGIDVTITAQDPTTVRPGGAPMRFSVALVNGTTRGSPQVGMVVSVAHCSCNPSGAHMMAAGSMRMLDPEESSSFICFGKFPASLPSRI